MKNSLIVLILLVMLILVGCSDEKIKSDENDSFVVRATYLKEEDEELKKMNMSAGTIMKNAFWVEKEENIHDFIDAIVTKDEDFFKQQIREGKIFHVDKDTKIYFSNDKLNDGTVIKIKFLQGKYKNKSGYTIAKFIYEI